MPAGWVSAGVAVLGAAENMSANEGSKSATAQNNANSQQIANAQDTALHQGEAIAQQPFQAYGGTLTVPMSGNQQQAYTQAAKTAGTGLAQQDNAKATSQIDQVAGNQWNSDTAQKYMNPYTSAVTNNAIENANRTYQQNLGSLKENAIGSGAFGGGREAIAESQLAGQNQLNIGNLTAKGNADAYDEALKTWTQDNTTKLNASKAYEEAGKDVTQMNSEQISDLLKTGGVSQVISQTNLNNQYGQFMREQNWSATQLQPLIGAISASKGGTTQTAPVQSNTANQLLGLGSTLAGLFGGGSGGNNTFDPNSGSAGGSAADIPNNFSISTSDIGPS